MSATPIVYSSADASAPVLDGTSGSLLALLRAILVAGYGAKAAAGWTEPFTAASNVAVFRNDHAVGTGAYYRVDDNSVSSGKSASYRGYKAMSALGSGTDAYPTVGQETVGLYIRKSAASGSTARDWWAIACRRWIYLVIDSNSVGLSGGQVYFWGDLDSMRPADAYHAAITGGRIADPSTAQNAMLWLTAVANQVAPSAVSSGMYVAGTYNQVASSTVAACIAQYPAATTIGGVGGYAYPSPVNTGLLFGRVLVHEAAYVARGWMPNLLAPWHTRVLTDLTTLVDVPVAGKTSISKLVSQRPDGANGGELIFDTSTSW